MSTNTTMMRIVCQAAIKIRWSVIVYQLSIHNLRAERNVGVAVGVGVTRVGGVGVAVIGPVIGSYCDRCRYSLSSGRIPQDHSLFIFEFINLVLVVPSQPSNRRRSGVGR